MEGWWSFCLPPLPNCMKGARGKCSPGASVGQGEGTVSLALAEVAPAFSCSAVRLKPAVSKRHCGAVPPWGTLPFLIIWLSEYL